MGVTTTDRTPARRATSVPGVGRTEPDYAALASTDSRQRRFITPDFYPRKQRSGERMLFLLVPGATGPASQTCLPAFQAGHAGSIPAARSLSATKVVCGRLVADPGLRPRRTPSRLLLRFCGYLSRGAYRSRASTAPVAGERLWRGNLPVEFAGCAQEPVEDLLGVRVRREDG